MNHLYRFNENNDVIHYYKDNVYYKIHSDKSLKKFSIALEKIGEDFLEDFLDEVDSESIDDIPELFQDYILATDVVYIAKAKNIDYWIWNDLPDDSDLRFGGEIYVKDYEVDSRKYNL
jgi:hypothetical protein